jgi:hypothetical protein
MTRDEFFRDCEEALRLISGFGLRDDLAQELHGKLGDLGNRSRGVTPDDLQRYSEAIDWGKPQDPRAVQRLAMVLLRITVGLAKELQSFQHAAKG